MTPVAMNSTSGTSSTGASNGATSGSTGASTNSGTPAAAPLAYSSGSPGATTGGTSGSAAPATIAPAPLAYHSGPTTIAVAPATPQAQAQRAPRVERFAVQNYLAKHKKKSGIDKWWGDLKKSLGIK
jgi:hypothetical protein